MKNQFIDEIKKIESKVNALHNDTVAVQKSNERRQQQLNNDLERIEGKYRRALNDIDDTKRQYHNAIVENQRIIDNLRSMINMLPEKVRTECQPVTVSMPSSIDIGYIASLFDNITTDTLSSAVKRLFRTGGHYKYTEMVKDFLMLCAEAELYLLNEIQTLTANSSAEVATRTKIAEDDHRTELARHEKLAEQLKAEETAETLAIVKKRNDFLSSNLIMGFSERMAMALSDSGALESDWKSYDPKRDRKYDLPIGNIAVPFKTESKSLQKALIERIPEYARDGFFSIPYIAKLTEPLRLLFKYSAENEKKASEQIQLILLRMLRSAPADTFDIYFVDPEDRGNNIGILNAASEENEKISIYTRNSKDEIRALFKQLEKEIDDVGRLIGSYNSVYEYNQANGNATKEKVLVLFDFPKSISAEEISIFGVLVNNAKRCGLHIIVATGIDWSFVDENSWCIIDIFAKKKRTTIGFPKIFDRSKIENRKNGDIFIANVRDISISSNGKLAIFKISANDIDLGDALLEVKAKSTRWERFKSIAIGEYIKVRVTAPRSVELVDLMTEDEYDAYAKVFNYAIESLRLCHKSFVTLYRKAYADGLIIDNTFSHLFNISDVTSYKDGTDGLHLPVMVRTGKNGGVSDLVIGTSTSTHTLITGNTSSGKSTFLHMIISSIIMNYHPDDVEIWLVDYGKVEFNDYYQHTPPHVRFISLEKSAEFTYSFLDYLHEFFSKREKLFEAEGVTSIQGYRKKHGRLSMPRVVLIVDEFHNMTQHVQQNIDYRQILENALAEYRKFGFSCIFSNQTVSGLQGLTDTAKLQIKNRIALSNEIAEMKETLRVGNDNYTDDMLHRMERTSVGELWYKEWTSVSDFSINQFKGIYINHKERTQVLTNVCNSGVRVNNDTYVKRINSSERQLISLEQIQAKAITSMSSRKFDLCLGSPVTVEKMFSFTVEHRYNHNLLLVGRNIKLKRDIIINILLNAYLMKNFDIYIYADERDELFETLQDVNYFRSKTCNIKVFSDISKLCFSINNVVELITSKETQKKTLIFWFGLSDLFDEFNVSPRKENIKFANAETKDESTITIDDIELLENDEILIEEAKSLGITVREMLYNLSGDSQIKAVKENDYSYNACEDVLKIITNGGKFNIHSVIALDGGYDFRKTKGLNGDNFIHKIVLNIPKEDLFELGIRSHNIELEEGMSALYTDGSRFQKFRPYRIKQED